MATTTTSTIAGGINDSYIPRMMAMYARKKIVYLRKVRIENIAGLGTKTVKVEVPSKDSAAAIAENASLTTAAYTTASVSVSVSEYGIGRDVSKMARRTSIRGEQGLIMWLVEDGGYLCYEKMEQDGWTQFQSASTSQGTTGQPFTLSNYAGALGQLDINETEGEAEFFFSPKQTSDFRDACLSSSAAVFATGAANEVLAQTRDDGFVGRFLGQSIWMSSAASTVGGDKIGACAINGASRPDQGASVLVVLWWPEPEDEDVALGRTKNLAVTAATGWGEQLDRSYVKLVTRAS